MCLWEGFVCVSVRLSVDLMLCARCHWSAWFDVTLPLLHWSTGRHVTFGFQKASEKVTAHHHHPLAYPFPPETQPPNHLLFWNFHTATHPFFKKEFYRRAPIGWSNVTCIVAKRKQTASKLSLSYWRVPIIVLFKSVRQY